MPEIAETIASVLDTHRWYCSCGEGFDEPEDLQGHRMARHNQGDTGHTIIGYADDSAGEPLLRMSHHVWKGKWRDLLRRRIRQAAWEAEENEQTEERDGDDQDALSDSDSWAPEDHYFEGGRESKDDPELEEIEEGRGTTRHRVRVQYRPKVFEMDEAVVHLYHLHQAAAQRLGVRYSPPLGEWVRQVVFQFTLEHPELVDLSTILTPQERERLTAGAAA